MKIWHPDAEGYANVLGLRIFYRVFGESGSKGTVLCLHGGPGCASDYMLPLSDLTRFGYKVVLYDQMGTGRSQLPTNKNLLTVEQHVKEIEGVRNALKLGKVHLFGHSWGATIGT